MNLFIMKTTQTCFCLHSSVTLPTDCC